MWRTNGGDEIGFSVQKVTMDICNEVPRVIWWKLVWYAQCIPKHSFILWLAIHERLSTQDKLKAWGVQIANRCNLCLCDCEDLQHIFFQCSFSNEVWIKAKQLAEIKSSSTQWANIVNEMAGDEVISSIGSVIKRLVFAASVYQLWNERNNRIFKDKKQTCEEVFCKIVETVKYKLLGITVKESRAVEKVEEKWKIKCKRLCVSDS